MADIADSCELGWDEADVNTLLLDIADDDFYVLESSSSSNSEYECATDNSGDDSAIQQPMATLKPTLVPEPVKSTARHVTVRRFLFVCPVCSKELRSVSGFRGHVAKQHQNFYRLGFKGSRTKCFHNQVIIKFHFDNPVNILSIPI
jgi:hypothetical protein